MKERSRFNSVTDDILTEELRLILVMVGIYICIGFFKNIFVNIFVKLSIVSSYRPTPHPKSYMCNEAAHKFL